MRFVSCSLLLFVAFGTVGSASAQQTWRLDSRPIIDIVGADGGKVNFALAAGATRLADGSLLIADRGAAAVALFDPTGKLVKTVGRAGEGPGEFQTMVWAGGCGSDTLMVWDPRLRRASFIGKSGAVARQFTLGAERTPNALWFSCSGQTMAYLSEPTGRRAASATNIMTMDASVITLDRTGSVTATHPQISGGEWFLPGRGGFPRPLGAATTIAMVGPSLVIGTADSASILVLAPDGKRTAVRVPAERRAPTREEFDAAVQTIGSLTTSALRQTAIDGLSKAPMPALLPPYTSIFADPAGFVWVQMSPPGSRDVDFVVMSLDGRVVARARLPRTLTLYEIGRDYVLGSYSDSDDEMHVVAYRLRRQ